MIDRDQIASRIHGFLEDQFGEQGAELDESTALLDDFFLDSFAIIDTVMFLEKSFGIRVSRADINGVNFRDIASLAELVQTRLREAGA